MLQQLCVTQPHAFHDVPRQQLACRSHGTAQKARGHRQHDVWCAKRLAMVAWKRQQAGSSIEIHSTVRHSMRLHALLTPALCKHTLLLSFAVQQVLRLGEQVPGRGCSIDGRHDGWAAAARPPRLALVLEYDFYVCSVIPKLSGKVFCSRRIPCCGCNIGYQGRCVAGYNLQTSPNAQKSESYLLKSDTCWHFACRRLQRPQASKPPLVQRRACQPQRCTCPSLHGHDALSNNFN